VRSSSWFIQRKSRRAKRKGKLTDQVCNNIADFYANNCVASVGKAKHALGLGMSDSTVRRALRFLKLTRKRLSSKVLGTVSVDQLRDYKQRHASTVRSDTLVVSLDECSFSEKAQPMYGYSKAGVRCALRLRQGGWKQRSLVMAISSDGDYAYDVKDGAYNKESFGEFVLSLPYPPDTVCILDNCSIHKGMDDVFEAKGYIPLFLSPYSPQLQPVELAFSKMKNHFRSMWPWPEGVNTAIEQSVQTLQPSDIHGFFRHAQRALDTV
jgi:hypothetical protein